MRRLNAQGFTVVELVTVIVVMGILAIGSVRFINDAVVGYASTAQRAELSADVRQSLDRMAREIREALPNSVRVSASNDCIEYIPLVSASYYLSAPIGYSANSMNVVPFDESLPSGVLRAVVLPGGSVYSLGSTSAISPLVTIGSADADNQVPLTFTSSHQFAGNSPQRRMYLVDEPVSYCLVAGVLWRYNGYGFSSTQLGAISLPSSIPQRAMVVGDIDDSQSGFAVAPATLTRNAVATLNLFYRRGEDELDVLHSVQLRNQI